MHVGVEEVVAEHLREEDLHAVFRQAPEVRAARPQRRQVADRHAMDALHHHDIGAAQVPVHLGHVQQRRAGEIALELRSVGGLAHQVELIEHGLAVLAHHLDGPQPARLRPPALRQLRHGVHHFEVASDLRAHAGAQHLDHHFAPVRRRATCTCAMDAAASGSMLKSANSSPSGAAVAVLEAGARDARRETAAHGPGASPARRRCRRAAGRGASTAPGRTSRRSARAPRARAASRSARVAPRRRWNQVQGEKIEQEAQRAVQVRGAHEVVEPVAHQHALDLEQPADDAQFHGSLRGTATGASRSSCAPRREARLGTPSVARAAPRRRRESPRPRRAAPGRGSRAPGNRPRCAPANRRAARPQSPTAAERPRRQMRRDVSDERGRGGFGIRAQQPREFLELAHQFLHRR